MQIFVERFLDFCESDVGLRDASAVLGCSLWSLVFPEGVVASSCPDLGDPVHALGAVVVADPD